MAAKVLNHLSENAGARESEMAEPQRKLAQGHIYRPTFNGNEVHCCDEARAIGPRLAVDQHRVVQRGKKVDQLEQGLLARSLSCSNAYLVQV